MGHISAPSANAGGHFVVCPGISQQPNKWRTNETPETRPLTASHHVTMSAEDQQHLDVIRERFHDGNINQMPSRSLMLSVLIDWAFKHGFGSKHTEECCG